jgi:translation initiation factor IF-3
MILFIAPKKDAGKKKQADKPATDVVAPKVEKVAPKVKERKEYTGPKVEGEDF